MAPTLTLDQKKQQWAGIDSGLSTILSGKANGLVDSILKNFSPIDKEGKQKKKRLSIGSVFRGIGFAARHPIDTYNLVKLRKPEIYGDKDFQQHLLEKKELWDFIKKDVADRLPQAGKIVAEFTKNPLFQEGSVLDTNGLTHIQKLLRSDTSIGKIKEIALAVLTPPPRLRSH